MAEFALAQTMNAASHIDRDKRKANRRLALAIGLVALGFYLLMLFYSL